MHQYRLKIPPPFLSLRSMLVSFGGRSKRMWVNVSQEAKSAVDDLREKGYLNAIKVSPLPKLMIKTSS